MGLLGALLVIFLFALLAYFGLRTALRAPDNFGMLLATGITASLTLQAILNMAVIVAAAPPTGVTLPFISYGGSSLVTALAAIGILLNISRHGGLPVANRSGTGNSSPAPQTTRLAATASRRRVASVTRGTETRGTGKESYARFDFGWRYWWTRLSGAGRRRSVTESRKPVRSSRRAGERPTSQRTPTRR
jgi:hypothetical protein